MVKFSLGCDPEVFVAGPDGKVVSAHTFIPGSKKEPFKVTAGAIQPDGLSAEFNTDPVDYMDAMAFNNNVLTVLRELKKHIPADHKIVYEPTVQFDKEYYDSLPKEVKELGCDPDFCAYSENIFEPNPRPVGDSGMRSGAGHIHIGWGSDIPADNEDHVNICRNFIKQLDCYVGLIMTCIDGDVERRKLYGRAGAYRPKSYGVEYRTPSNAWIKTAGRRHLIHWGVRSAISNMKSTVPIYQQMQAGIIQEIINTGDADAAAHNIYNYIGYLVPGYDYVNKKFTRGVI